MEAAFNVEPQSPSETPDEQVPPSGRKSTPSMKSRGSVASVLVVDDDQDMCELMEADLTRRGYAVSIFTSPAQALAALDTEDFSVLLVDVNMEEMSGFDVCRAAVAKRPDLVVMVMTGFGSLEHAVGAIRAGAYDFIAKPISMDALALTLERTVRELKLQDELKRLRRRVDSRELPKVVSESPAMQHVADIVNRIADSDASVLITGESGTGKELVARGLHERSGRRGAFLAVNCAAIPETLLESELFGHARGAFTDARNARAGLFVEANGGTLFLDEIGEMPLGVQAKILRALQERKVRPVGSNVETPFEARIITATNRDLEGEIAEKRFREDLYYRINVVRVEVPPLRARGNDILLLAQFFLERAALRRGSAGAIRLGRSVAERLLDYDWPGNVRELENCIERAVALARYDEMTLDDLPAKIREHRASEVAGITADPKDLPSMEVVEERYIRKVLAAVGGNKTHAAKVLRFDRRTLYRKLTRLDLA
ncbi:MAG TPA: sigma-54 dependent transcriptional regulator [Polyangiaceae bacterium]|jgi:two-component system response regulator HydG